ncbi:tetratricopeptide repeat protein 31-like isoform X2 [Salarias fasciatus]|uniref:Tetratricopeptide repeat protein 31-like n=1 Tax=Salarias fasciatus TaxID=181472 RepID=A0A672FYY9_SALFA|nr:tetratricopeptide repeat protein 31-like isoform X2 [Salarias fasciatus]
MHMFPDEADFTDFHAYTVVNMFGRNPNFQRILKHSLGLQYDGELGFPGDDGDDHDNWVRHHRNFHAPLRHVDFSDDRGRRSASSNFLYQPSRNFRASSHDISSLSLIEVQPKEKDTESKARLIQETKQSKAKAEKKKKKKLKQKERKRREKLEKEKQNAAKNEAGKDGAQQGEEVEGKPDCDEDNDDDDDANSSGKPAAPAEDYDSSEQESSDGDYDSCASEELDMGSSFVSKAALIAKRKLEQKPKKEKKVADKEETQTVHNKPSESQEADKKDSAAAGGASLEDNIQKSNDFAVFGNKCASSGDFNMAVKFFTDAIKFNPTEFKLFGNRSFCFEKLQEYEKALADAQLALGISPGWVKGLFRKGRALAGLKRYEEAAQAFRDVLKQDSMCAEAAQELMRVQITQLMELGFTREQSSNALIIHGTLEKASEVLSKLQRGAGGVQNVSPPSMQVANVTGVSPVLSASIGPASPPPPPHAGAAAPLPPPSAPLPPAFVGAPLPPAGGPAPRPAAAQHAAKNPPKSKPVDPATELFPVWVGNLNHTITDSVIKNLFSKAGTVASVKVLTARRCAFVNFTDQESCEDAIRRFHGYELNGVTLAVRYPDRIAPGMNISKSALRANSSAR